MATVSLQNIYKLINSTTILDNICLDINKGEFVVIVGSSGSGKSTLLRLLAGLDSVTAGKIIINDQCVNNISPGKRDMAMVFQSYALYPHMTVYANMAWGLKLRGMDKREIHQRVTEVSKLLHLDDYLLRKPAELSGGQRQRVAMGRAIVRQPAVFLFDEPLSNLDAKLRTEMRLEIKKLHERLHTTCIYITHDQIEAMTLADRVVILNQGKIEQIGTPAAIYQRPASLFVAGFIGHHPMNFIHAETATDGLNTEFGLKIPLPCRYTGKADHQFAIGVRPENIILRAPGNPGIAVKVSSVDDLGADKLLRVIPEGSNKSLLVRTFDKIAFPGENIVLELDLTKANLFDVATGLEAGGWSD